MFQGIALGGHKAAGKDAALDYIVGTRANFKIVRCKTPIVKAFEKFYDHAYDKATDDAKLINFSANIARKQNPNIVKEYLLEVIPEVISKGFIPILPDMRFHEENEACFDLTDMLCIKIEADEDVCRERLRRRDGNLRNVVKNDPCEVACDDLKYHYVVDNNRDDDFKFAATQLEDYLRRSGAVFAQQADHKFHFGERVRVINSNSGYHWDEGVVQEMNAQLKIIGVEFAYDKVGPFKREFHISDLMPVK